MGLKKQIVFVEGNYNVPSFKLAKELKLKGYDTVIVLFSKLDEKTAEFLSQAYSKIIMFDIGNIRNFSIKNFLNIFSILRSREKKDFLNKIKSLKPEVVQIMGPDIVTALASILFRKYPIVYFAHDIWKPYFKKFSFKKGSGRMIHFNKIVENLCFRLADGVLHKGPENELEMLNIKTKKTDAPYLSGCMEEWSLKPSMKNKLSKKDKEFHLVYAGRPWIKWQGHSSFLDIIKIITSQKIHFHIFSLSFRPEDKTAFENLAKTNKYFHLHKEQKGRELNKSLSAFDFGVVFDYIDSSIIGRDFAKITLGTKIFAYLEAGIPSIISDDLEFTSKVIEEENAGFSISYAELKNLKKIILSKNYPLLLKGVERAQKDFAMKKVACKIEKFYEEVCNKFKN